MSGGKTKNEAMPLALDSFGGDDMAASVFLKKYSLSNDDKYYEYGMDDLHKRLKKGMLHCEKEKFGKNESELESLRKQYKQLFDYFLFGGRILYALENPFDTTATLSNCYVTDIECDSIEDIFNTAKRQARIFSKGGGVGFDISTLRPSGAKVNNSARTTTGSVSFMDLYSLVTGLIGQHGRRGALMLSISVEHPDLLDFIKVKGGHDKSKVEFANISVRITDAFMNAVENNKDWKMTYTLKDGSVFEKTEKAKVIWSLIVESNRRGAEPGMLFWDSIINDDVCSAFPESIPVSTNPCLTADTIVLTTKGYVRIDEIVKNINQYELVTYNTTTKQTEVEKIVWGDKTRESANVITLVIEEDDREYRVTCTPDHKIYTSNRGYIEARDLTDEDDIVVNKLENVSMVAHINKDVATGDNNGKILSENEGKNKEGK